MNKTTIIAAAAIAGSAIAGCGTTATSSSSSPRAPSAPTTAPASQPAPGGIPVTQTVREGQPFTVSFDYAAGYGSASWKLTLDSMTCGNGTIFDPRIMAQFYSAEGMPTVVPQADPGQKFCLVKFSITNEGDSNRSWSGPETLNVGLDAYQDTGGARRSGYGIGTASDAEGAYNNYALLPGQSASGGLQPGQSGVDWSVFEVPSGATVTSVSVAATAYSGGAQVVVITKTVTVPAPAKTVTMPAESSQPQPSASSAPQPSTSFQGDPTAGSGTGPACTTIAGYFPGGLPGHEDATGFCVPDKLGRARATSF